MINNIFFLKKEIEKIKILFSKKKFESVIKKTSNLLKKNPDQPMLYNFIGFSYLELGKYDMAINLWLSAIEKFPSEPSILCNIGITFKAKWNFSDARKYFRLALDKNPKHLQSYINLGNLETSLNNNQLALSYYLDAYKINNSSEEVLTYLALSYSANGDFIKAKKIINELNMKFTNNTKSYQLYSKIHTYQNEDSHQKNMLEILKSKKLNDEDLANIYFALAKSFFDQKNTKKFVEYTLKANETKFKTFYKYNFDKELQQFDKIKRYFKNFQFNETTNDKGENLIFILGLPRSGTTLMHQIISSHSKVVGAEESDFLYQSLTNKFVDENDFKNFFASEVFDRAKISKLSDDILSKYRIYHENKIIVDKNPFNFKWVGFIKILFPKAKIIHSNRRVIDSAFSIYRNVFDSPLGWAYHQNYLVQYIKNYRDLMKFWDDQLGDYIYNYQYENLVHYQLEETKKVLNFCKLEFEENCFDYTKNKIPVRTISVAQVRQKIYKTSVKLSETFTEHFPFLKNI